MRIRAQFGCSRVQVVVATSQIVRRGNYLSQLRLRPASLPFGHPSRLSKNRPSLSRPC